MFELLQQPFQPKDLDSRRGKLDCQRQTVKAATDLGDDPGLRVAGLKVRAGGAGALHEERQGGIAQERPAAGPDRRFRHLERRNLELLLTPEAERLAAGRQETEPGSAGEQVGQGRGGCHHVLEVVEDEQELPRGQIVGHRLDQRPVPLLFEVELLRDQCDHALGTVGRSERDKHDAIGQFVGHRTGDAKRQTSLPDAARTGEGEQSKLAPAQ